MKLTKLQRVYLERCVELYKIFTPPNKHSDIVHEILEHGNYYKSTQSFINNDIKKYYETLSNSDVRVKYIKNYYGLYFVIGDHLNPNKYQFSNFNQEDNRVKIMLQDGSSTNYDIATVMELIKNKTWKFE